MSTRTLVRRIAPAPVLAYAVLACGVLASCGPPGDGLGGEQQAPAVWRIDPEPLLSIGALEGDSAYLFGRVRTARFLERGRIAVADEGLSVVRVYDGEGRFLAQLGGPGDGPGEFRVLRAVWVAGPDTVGVWDSGALRLSWFAADGRFLRSLTLVRPAEAGERGGLDAFVGVFSDGSVALAAVAFGPRQVGLSSADRMTVERYDARGTFMGTMGEVTGLVRAVTAAGGGPIPLSPYPSFALVDDSVAFTDGTGTLRLWGDDPATGRVVRFPRTDLSVEAALGELEAELERRAQADPESEATWQLAMMSDMPRPDSIPSTAGLLVDSEGRFWAKRFGPAQDAVQLMDGPGPRGGPWWVMDRDGRIVAAVDVPEGLTPVDARGDRVLAVGRDALGVERVSIHEILRPR